MRLSPIYLLPFAMLLARARASSSAGELWVSTLDEPRQCIERSITVSGGAPPYKLSAVQVGQPDAIIVVIQNAIPQPCEVVWLCSIQQKTSFILKLEDSQGQVALSAARTSAPGNGDVCEVVAGSPQEECDCNEAAPSPGAKPTTNIVDTVTAALITVPAPATSNYANGQGAASTTVYTSREDGNSQAMCFGSPPPATTSGQSWTNAARRRMVKRLNIRGWTDVDDQAKDEQGNTEKGSAYTGGEGDEQGVEQAFPCSPGSALLLPSIIKIILTSLLAHHLVEL